MLVDALCGSDTGYMYLSCASGIFKVGYRLEKLVEKTSIGMVIDGELGLATVNRPMGLCWDNDLSNEAISAELLKQTLAVDFAPTEGLWIADMADHSIRLICQGKIITLCRGNSSSSKDGKARAYSMSTTSFATTAFPADVRRLSHRPLVLFSEWGGTLPPRVRLLNMSSWTISTLRTLDDSSINPPNWRPSIFVRPFESTGHVQLACLPTAAHPASAPLSFRMNVDTGSVVPDYAKTVDFDGVERKAISYPISLHASRPMQLDVCYLPNSLSASVTYVRGLIQADGSYALQGIGYPVTGSLPLAYNPTLDIMVVRTLDDTSLVFHYLASRRTPRILAPIVDLTSFINHPSLRNFSTAITHAPSSSTWMVSFDLLRSIHPELNEDLVKAAVRNSTLPVSSVSAFIDCLHLSPLPKDLGWRNTLLRWYHILLLMNKSNISAAWIVREFTLNLWPSLNSDALRGFLLDALWHLDEKWPQDLGAIVDMLFGFPSPQHATASSKEDSEPSSRLAALRPTGLRSVFLSWEEMSWPPAPSSLLKRSSDFAFSMRPPNDQSLAIVGNLFFMYARWRWFKRLVDDPNSSRSRVALIPTWMTQTMLTAILEVIHGDYHALLSEQEAVVLLEHAHEVSLVDDEYTALAPFGGLWTYCLELTFPGIDDLGILGKFVKHHCLGNRAQVITIRTALIRTAASKGDDHSHSVTDALVRFTRRDTNTMPPS